MGAFSFYPTKNMTTGEGGMITTNDSLLAQECRMLINHGSRKRYYHEALGYNFRLTDIGGHWVEFNFLSWSSLMKKGVEMPLL